MISLANLPMKLTLSSTGENRGIGMAVDWYTLCQSKICQQDIQAKLINIYLLNLVQEKGICPQVSYMYIVIQMAITFNDLPLTLTDLCPEEAVTLLLHVVVDDSGNFLLPNLQAVDIDIVLDVLKGPPEPVHSLSQTL